MQELLFFFIIEMGVRLDARFCIKKDVQFLTGCCIIKIIAKWKG